MHFSEISLHKMFLYADAWTPAVMQQTEYLEAELAGPTPIFGLELLGSPETGAYVTSFTLLHSDDGQVYSFILNAKNRPQVSNDINFICT